MIPNKTHQHPTGENRARKATEGVHLPVRLARATEPLETGRREGMGMNESATDVFPQEVLQLSLKEWKIH